MEKKEKNDLQKDAKNKKQQQKYNNGAGFAASGPKFISASF